MAPVPHAAARPGPTRPVVQDRAPAGASRGQVLIMMALFLVGLMGVLGLATDVGMAFAQRRTMQNAADAGALAGARAMAKWTAAAPTAAGPEVAAFVAANRMHTVPEVADCHYVDYAGGHQGACAATVTPAARGVRVVVREVHQTFFVRVVPGAPDQVTVAAEATSFVEGYAGFPSQAPFLVCGSHSWAVGNADGTATTGTGTDVPILLRVGGTWEFNPAAFGVTYRIHDNKISQSNGVPKAAGCKAMSARFNGISDQPKNAGKGANQWFNYVEGTDTGPTVVAVDGVQGCKVGQVRDCVMLIPLVADDPTEVGNNKELFVVTYAAFYVTRHDVNSHNGRLLRDYVVSGPSTREWCRECDGVVAVVRLGA